MSLLVPLLLATQAHAADPTLPAGKSVDPALYLDITRYALEKRKIEAIFDNFLPESLPVDSLVGDQLSQDGSVGSSFLGVEYDLKVENLVIKPTLLYVDIVPKAGDQCRPNSPLYDNGYLDVELGVDVGLNSPQDPARAKIRATADLLGFLSFDLVNDTCNIFMAPQPATVTIKVAIGFPIDDNDVPSVDDGFDDPFDQNFPPTYCPYRPLDWYNAARAAGVSPDCRPLFIDVYDFSWHFGNDERGVQLDDIDLNCGSLVDFLKDMADTLGLLPQDIIAQTLQDSADPAIQEALSGVETDLQSTLDEFFAPENGYKFKLDEPMNVLGMPVDFELCPNDVLVDDRGVHVGMSGKVIGPTEPAPCVAAYDVGGSRVTVPPTGAKYPTLGQYYVDGLDDVLHLPQTPAPTNPAEVAVGLNDDFFNQALYTLWRGGLLCQNLDPSSLSLELPAGLSLDTGLLNTLSASAFEDAFPPDPVTRKGKPLVIATSPRKPPVVATDPDGPNDAYIDLQDFGIDMYAESEYRQVRAVGLMLSATPGIGLAFESATGSLAASVNLDPSSLEPKVVYNELAPSASTTLENGLGELISSFVGPLLDDALSGFQFQLPAFAGLGVQNLSLAATGPGQDWIGAYGNVGFVAYAPPGQTGCDAFGSGCGGGCGGSGGSSCGGGCDTRGASGAGLFLLPALIILRRRRA